VIGLLKDLRELRLSNNQVLSLIALLAQKKQILMQKLQYLQLPVLPNEICNLGELKQVLLQKSTFLIQKYEY
jgi:hypothetical protein